MKKNTFFPVWGLIFSLANRVNVVQLGASRWSIQIFHGISTIEEGYFADKQPSKCMCVLTLTQKYHETGRCNSKGIQQNKEASLREGGRSSSECLGAYVVRDGIFFRAALLTEARTWVQGRVWHYCWELCRMLNGNLTGSRKDACPS